MESGMDAPIPAAAATPVGSAAAAAVGAVTEMTNRLTLDADAAASNGRPLELDDADGNIYTCKGCRTHLARAADIISKDFCGHLGRAYLVDKVVNVTVGEKQDCMMNSGMHTASDIFCVGCGELVGLRYEAAYERSQKYKEGKFHLDRYQIRKQQ